MSAQRELRTLLQEETALVNLASKISDQLNRLKVEELALQNLVRIQNEEQERHLRGSMSAGSSKMLEEQDIDEIGEEEEEGSNKDDLDLSVSNQKKWKEIVEEEEEEEEEEETYEKMTTSMHYDIEDFVGQL